MAISNTKGFASRAVHPATRADGILQQPDSRPAVKAVAKAALGLTNNGPSIGQP